MTSIAGIPLDDLTQRCVEETDKFGRRQPNDPQFCFELLRRALAEGISEAFTHVYQVYERQVLRWVYSHSRFEQTGESADLFARSALSNFYFALRGAKFERFAELPQVLTYLKLCVHTAIVQYLRDQQPSTFVPLDAVGEAAYTPDLATRADAAELWAHIERLVSDERDRLLARCIFIQDLKPRQIVAAYPTHWRDEREVSVNLFRLRRKLRSDAELRQRVGLAPDEAADEHGV